MGTWRERQRRPLEDTWNRLESGMVRGNALEGQVLPGTTLVLRTRRRVRWRYAVPAAVLAVVVAVAIVVATGLRPAGGSTTQTVRLDGGATVTARLLSGRLTATTLHETPDLVQADALGAPIRVTADRRKLDGPATISFPVTVPAGLDPAQDVGIAMRSPDTGGHWVYVGGAYDPATRRVSVSAQHFSDWLPIVHDIRKLAAKAEGFLTGLIGANPPTASCSGEQRGVEVRDPITPALTACLSTSGDGQIANPHGVPLDLTLPRGVTVTSNNTRQTLGESLWIPALEAVGGGKVVLGESVRAFRLDQKTFDKSKPGITASVDVPTFVFDMAEFLVGQILPEALDEEEQAGTLAEPTDKLIGCVRDSAGALKNRPDIGSFLSALGTLIKTCYLPAAKDLLAATAKKLSVNLGKDALEFLFRPLQLIFQFGEYRRIASEALSGAKILASGPYKPVIGLFPDLAPDKVADLQQHAKSGDCNPPWWASWMPFYSLVCKGAQWLLN